VQTVATRRRPPQHRCGGGRGRRSSQAPRPRPRPARQPRRPGARPAGQGPQSLSGRPRGRGEHLAGSQRLRVGRPLSAPADAGTAACRSRPRSDRLALRPPARPSRCRPPRLPVRPWRGLQFPRQPPPAADAGWPKTSVRPAPRRYARRCGQAAAALAAQPPPHAARRSASQEAPAKPTDSLSSSLPAGREPDRPARETPRPQAPRPPRAQARSVVAQKDQGLRSSGGRRPARRTAVRRPRPGADAPQIPVRRPMVGQAIAHRRPNREGPRRLTPQR
jgi:hypothetical protein